MDLDKLRPLLQGVPALDQHLDAYRQSGGSDSSEFVALLHDQGLVDDTTLREVLTSGEVTQALTDLVPGETSGSRYRLLGFLAQGAMGEIHVARDLHLQRNVAIKRIREPLRAKDAATRRFHTEISVCAQLDHPGIVPVYSLEHGDDGTVGYAMKLIRGKTLKRVIADVREAHDKGQAPDPDLRARVEIFLQACAAVHFAHTRGVIHRDLKPDNIMIGPFHEVLVMDWGLARVLTRRDAADLDGAGSDSDHTAMGVVLGTPAYLSPEQARGDNDALGPPSDQFTLGLILFELVTLKRAVSARHANEASAQIVRGQFEPLVHYLPREPVPRELAAVIRKATALKPQDRYSSVEDLAQDLRRWLSDQPVHAAPDTPLQAVARWVAHHRELTLALGLTLVVLLVLVVASGLAGGTAWVVSQRAAAKAREDRLSDAIGAVSAQAHLIDGDFRRYEGLLEGLVQAAQFALAHPAEPALVYTGAQYREGQGPADLLASKVYGGPVSLGHLDHQLAPGSDPQALLPTLHQLEQLRPMMFEMLVRSDSQDLLARPLADQQDHVANRGVPLVWVYLALESGVLTGMPGKGDYPEGYDVRDRAWYKTARDRGHLGWGAVDWDESGAGLLLPCSAPLRDPQGRFIGLAAFDVTLDHLVRDLLPLRDLPAPTEAWILDRQGRVVVRQSLRYDRAEARENVAKARELPLFPYEEVRDALRDGVPRGHRELDLDGRTDLVLWSALDVADWTYVVTGERDELLE
jgi:tRNA A-37 threonylcarbamoyl transferase component Bud32